MNVITVTTPFNIEIELLAAPFHKRLLAWFIDIVIVYAFAFGLAYTLSISFRGFNDVIFTLIILLPAYLYHLYMEILLKGQTFGKKAVGIQVVDKSGKEPSLSQYFLRWVLRLIDMGFTMGVGATICYAMTPYNQRIGDLAAGTIVIDKRSRTNIHDTIYLDIDEKLNYTPRFPEVMRLTDRDINGIRNLLDMRYSHDTDVYMLQVAYRIKEVLQIQADMEVRDFLHQLLMDYNYLSQKK
jgi:uncharacterized RDD family membrane protein YckC